jgi:hypothetical protein
LLFSTLPPAILEVSRSDYWNFKFYSLTLIPRERINQFSHGFDVPR